MASAALRNATAVGEGLLAVSPWAPAPKPHSPVGVTPAFITRTFADRAPGAVALGIEVVSGTSGTTDRCRIAVSWNARGVEAGLPQTMYVKSTPTGLKNRIVSASTGLGTTEVRFYNSCRPSLGPTVSPISYFAHAGHGARHLILLEDITGDRGRPCAVSEEASLEHVEGLMRTFGQLHAAFWMSPRFKTDLKWVVPLDQRPGWSLLVKAFRRNRKLLQQREELNLSPMVRRMCDYVNAHDTHLFKRWERGPLTLIHGDSHMGNTFVMPGGKTGLMDWQIVHRAPSMRELAYFLVWSAPTELRRKHDREWIALYLETLAEHGVKDAPSFDQAWEDYRFFAFEAWDSIAFGIAMPGMQSLADCMAGFNRANAAVEDLEADVAVRRWVEAN